jgi:hypothetical protein
MNIRQIITCVALLLASMFLLMVCKEDSPTDSHEKNQSSKTISSSGGKVEDSYGASIAVPAGALSSNMTISIRTIHADSIPADLQSGIVGNMIECLPHGAKFLQPVMIVLPVTSGHTYQAGDSANLYIYNADSSGWELTGTPAVVTSDGHHLRASVMHFSDFGSGSPGSYGGGGKKFEDIHNWLELEMAINGFTYSCIQSLGGLGTKKRIRDCCYTLRNVEFKFFYSSPGYNQVYSIGYGDQGGCDLEEKQNYSEGTPDEGYHIYVNIKICWGVCSPEVSMSVSQSQFYLPDDAGKTSDVDLKVLCGSEGFGGQQVELSVSGPGQIDPASTTTDAGGTVLGTYTVTGKGTASINAQVQTCQSAKPTSGSATAAINIDSTEADYVAAIVTITHSTGVWTFTDEVRMLSYIKIENENVTIKEEEGSHTASCTSSSTHCSVVGFSAPNFKPGAQITKIGNTLDVKFVPDCAINFTWHCPDLDPPAQDSPVPLYGNLVTSLIAIHIKGILPMEVSAVITGSGSESFGEDLPLTYSYQIMYGTKNTH